MKIKIYDSHNVTPELDEKLREFEEQFSYPLGDKTFTIEHGYSGARYMSFFDTLGDAKIIVIYDEKGNIQGVGCAVLRTVLNKGQSQKFWYLCDFKLDPSIRGKGLIQKMFYRFVIPFYLRSNKMVAFNMSPPGENKIAGIIGRAFKLMSIEKTEGVFFEFGHQFYRDRKELFDDYVLYTNYGSKDIIVDGKVRPVIHLVKKDHAMFNLEHHRICNSALIPEELSKDAIYMLMTTNADEADVFRMHMEPSARGTLISKSIDVSKLNFSSAEI